MKPRIVLSGVNLMDMGPLAVFKEALESIARHCGGEYEIVALVHRRDLFEIPDIVYLEFPAVKSSWMRRLWFEYVYVKKLSRKLRPKLWLSMHDITPNVVAETRAVYCHNPSPFYRFQWRNLSMDWKFALFTFSYRFLYRINIRSNHYVIVQQDWIRREFQSRYGVRNVIVAHPEVKSSDIISTPRQRESQGVYRFFFPAFPRTPKNAEVCLEASRLLERRGFRAFELWLTFDGSVNRYSKELVERYSDVGSVRWLGLQSRDQVYKLYSEADCLLFPSKLETWGLPITEFKATGKPILAADIAYAHETVGSYGEVAFFDPDNPTQLADLMEGAAMGKAVFGATEAAKIDEPFAHNWAELWPLLLNETHPN
jgi:glycosyltransferase involved in cell wall biosynthesis